MVHGPHLTFEQRVSYDIVGLGPLNPFEIKTWLVLNK